MTLHSMLEVEEPAVLGWLSLPIQHLEYLVEVEPLEMLHSQLLAPWDVLEDLDIPGKDPKQCATRHFLRSCQSDDERKI